MFGFDVTWLLSSSATIPPSQEALHMISEFQKHHWPDFLLSLAHEVSDGEKGIVMRFRAANILKSSLTNGEEGIKEDLDALWHKTEPGHKKLIKVLLLKTPSYSRRLRREASIGLARILLLEVRARNVQGPTQDEWPGIIDQLILPNQPESLKVSILEAIQCICEELSHCQVLVPAQIIPMFTLIVQEINGAKPEICLAASVALKAAISFAKFKHPDIMEFFKIRELVAEKTLAKDSEVRKIAVQCLCIAYPSFYDMLKPYIDVIFKLMINTFSEDKHVISRHFEFLPELCNILNLPLWREEVVTSKTYYDQILSSLVPMFLDTFLKQHQDNDQDEGIWEHTECCSTFLQLAANYLKDAVVPLVEQFIENNILKPCWRSHRAVIHLVGLIMEGPSIESLVGLRFDFIVDTMRDKSCQAKDTVAWTLSRIFEFCHCPRTVHCCLLTTENLEFVIQALLEYLKDPPYISVNVCTAVYFLAQGCGNGVVDASVFGHSLVTGLMAAGDREDANDSEFVVCVNEALRQVIRCLISEDNYNVIVTILPTVISRLSKTTQIQVKEADICVEQEKLPSLCRVLHSVILKLGGSRKTNHLILRDANEIFGMIDKIFSCAVEDEALLAEVGGALLLVVSALIHASGQKFGSRVVDVWKYVKVGLKDYHSKKIYHSSTIVISKICGALGDEALPLYNEVMCIFFRDLSSNELLPALKSAIFSCIGKIALASGVHFEKYIQFVVQWMRDAEMECRTWGEEMVELGDKMSVSILKTCSAVCQGFKNRSADLFTPYAFSLLDVLRLTMENRSRNKHVIKLVVAVLDEISDISLLTLEDNLPRCRIHAVWISLLVEACLDSEDEGLRIVANRISTKIPLAWVGRQVFANC